jgi:hypothetical protein
MRTLDVTRVFRAAQHRNIKRRLEIPFPDPRENFEAGEARNLQIQKNEIWVRGSARQNRFQMLHGSDAVDRMDHIARQTAFFQRPSEEKRIVFRIFNEKHTWTGEIAGHEDTRMVVELVLATRGAATFPLPV